MFRKGTIEGVVVKDIVKFIDERGWLAEVFRKDEMAKESVPLMGYISMTLPHVSRGPHEHIQQTDNFGFLGPSNFKIYLWDNRKESSTFMVRQIVYAGEDSPKSLLVPPGVAHAYTNVGSKVGMVVNFPNKLFAGEGKKGEIDEVRHEDDPETIFKLD